MGKSSSTSVIKPYDDVRPFKINGVPLRRVNQSYVITTLTKVDIAGVNVEKFDDKYFVKKVEKKKKRGEGEFFEAEKEETKVVTLINGLESQNWLSVGFNLGFSVPMEAQEKVVSFPFHGQTSELKHGSVVIAAITSCTNTSNPSVMLGAGLVAKKACELGLEWPAKVSRPAGIQYSGIWLHHMYWELGRF